MVARPSIPGTPNVKQCEGWGLTSIADGVNVMHTCEQVVVRQFAVVNFGLNPGGDCAEKRGSLEVPRVKMLTATDSICRS